MSARYALRNFACTSLADELRKIDLNVIKVYMDPVRRRRQDIPVEQRSSYKILHRAYYTEGKLKYSDC